MRRREFLLAFASGAALSWPPPNAHADLPAKIGFLDSGSPAAFAGRLAKFREGLAEGHFIEGQNLTIEYRWAEGRYERLPELAKQLVESGVKVIAATGSPNSAKAALAATASIPIVFANGGDPVQLGLVSNLSRPPSNITGVSFFNSDLLGKRLEIARELVPGVRKAGFVVNPANPNTPRDVENANAAARQLGLELVLAFAAAESQFEAAFTEIATENAMVAVVNNDAFFSSRPEQLAALAARYRLPTIYYLRSFVAAGGLVSYGTDIEDMYREAGSYVARILSGTSPADLPVMRPVRFQFVINLSTARVLGLSVPPSLLARADELIE